MRPGGTVKKLLSLFLILTLLFLSAFTLISCKPDDKTDAGSGSGDHEDPPDDPIDTPDDQPDPDEGENYDSAGIIVPEYKDYGRGTLDFSVLALDYSRPNIDELCADFAAVSELIKNNEISFEEQLAAIRSLEDGYNDFLTMYTVAEIHNSNDLTAVFWASEHEYLSAGAPAYAKEIESLYVACARSPHARAFEEHYFKEDISEYEDGGKYTDAAVAYMSEEAALENEYKALSPSTVEIVYTLSATEKIEGTYEYVLEALEERYSDRPAAYQNALWIADMLYTGALERESRRIFVELVKVRGALAEEMGYDSYTELAYEDMEYQYSSTEMMALIEEIGEFVVPAYTLLYCDRLESTTPKWSTSTLINSSYSIAKNIDEGFGEIFAYMLQHGLYDVAPSSNKRLDASFTTWIENNSSPFMFITTTGYVTDYTTVMHEFGHFIDGYVNNNEHNSLEVAELCSQGLELLSLFNLKSYVTASAYDQMIYLTLTSTLSLLWYQGMLSCFELLAYDIPYAEISDTTLDRLLTNAEEIIFGRTGLFGMSDMLILHLFTDPMYVQSYCTSVIPAIEIYLMEAETTGAGLGAYKSVIYREEEAFLALLEEAGLTSPFEDGAIEDIIDRLSTHLGPIITKYS